MRSFVFRCACRLGLLGLLVLALGASAGCGNRTGTVTGKITYNNAPVKGGHLTFLHQEGKRSVSVQIAEDGTYTIDRIPVGEVKIVVETESLNPMNAPRRMVNAPPAGQVSPHSGPATSVDTSNRYTQIPERFQKAETTDLTYKVVPGPQEYHINLSQPAPQ